MPLVEQIEHVDAFLQPAFQQAAANIDQREAYEFAKAWGDANGAPGIEQRVNPVDMAVLAEVFGSNLQSTIQSHTAGPALPTAGSGMGQAGRF